MTRTILTKTIKSESSTSGRPDSPRAGQGIIGILAGIPSRMARRAAALTKLHAKTKKSVKSNVKAKKSAPKKKVAKKVTARKAAPKKTTAKRATPKTPKKKTAAGKKATSKMKTKKTTVARAASRNVKKKATTSSKTILKSKSKDAPKKVASKKPSAKKPVSVKKAPSKTTKATKAAKTAKAPKTDPKASDATGRRRPRIYSTRSTHDSFIIGDEIIFRQVRDWSNSNRLVEMRGTLIAMGTDLENHVNYIEVQFEVEGPTGRTEKQVRRFFVR